MGTCIWISAFLKLADEIGHLFLIAHSACLYGSPASHGTEHMIIYLGIILDPAYREKIRYDIMYYIRLSILPNITGTVVTT